MKEGLWKSVIFVTVIMLISACGGGGGGSDGNSGDSIKTSIGRCVDPDDGKERDIVSPTVGQLKIMEWMPDPTAVADTDGEWFELRASASFDLNGLQAGDTALGATPIVSSPQCVEVNNGSYVVFARNASSASNGSLGPVNGTFTFNLLNANGQLRIGVGSVELDSVSWTTATSGLSIQIDTDGTQCSAPFGTSTYNGTDYGTPGMIHALECP